MRLCKIKIENNPILWNIELNFTRWDWTIYDNIIFIWENGSGKTTLLNIIFDFSNFEIIRIWGTIEKRSFIIELSDLELKEIKWLFPKFWLKEEEATKRFEIIYDLGITKSEYSQIKVLNTNSQVVTINIFIEGKPILKSIFSVVSIKLSR